METIEEQQSQEKHNHNHDHDHDQRAESTDSMAKTSRTTQKIPTINPVI